MTPHPVTARLLEKFHIAREMPAAASLTAPFMTRLSQLRADGDFRADVAADNGEILSLRDWGETPANKLRISIHAPDGGYASITLTLPPITGAP